MPVIWTNFAVALPVDGDTIWARQFWIEKPMIVVWHSATLTVTTPSGLELSWEFLSKWRPL